MTASEAAASHTAKVRRVGIEWADKLARYHELEVKELLRLDPEAPAVRGFALGTQ